MRKCEKCDQGFEKESNFRFHKDVLHKDVLTSSYFGGAEDIETKFRCEICETKFKTEKDLNEHKKAVWCDRCPTTWDCKFHNQRSKCTNCDEKLSCKAKYETHWYHKHKLTSALPTKAFKAKEASVEKPEVSTPMGTGTLKNLNAKNVIIILIRKVILTFTRMPSVTIIMTVSARLKILSPNLGVNPAKLNSKQKEI